MGRGVPQGDSLSPLTFNLLFNTFMRRASLQQFGFSSVSLCSFHWLRFADEPNTIHIKLQKTCEGSANRSWKSWEQQLNSQDFIFTSTLTLASHKNDRLWRLDQKNMPQNYSNSPSKILITLHQPLKTSTNGCCLVHLHTVCMPSSWNFTTC